MYFPDIRHSTLNILTFIFAFILLAYGVANLIPPPDSHVTRHCVIAILAGLFTFFSLFRPYSGAFFLFIYAVVLSFILGGFFRHVIPTVVVLLGVLSFIRGRLSLGTPPDDEDQAS